MSDTNTVWANLMQKEMTKECTIHNYEQGRFLTLKIPAGTLPTGQFPAWCYCCNGLHGL